MARPLRVEFSGAVYHVTCRGNAKQAVFLDDADREEFFTVLTSVVKRFNWLCHAYCLMGNHYHLVIETPEGNISRGMRQLDGVYTQRFNRRHERAGHLFQGRFHAVLVEKESHLLALCRYVVLNPIRAKLVASPHQWKWSSFRATASEIQNPPFLTVNWILSQFGTTKKDARAQYKRFVSEGIGTESLWKGLKGQVILGTDAFADKFRELLKEKETIKEIPRVQRYITRPLLTSLLPPQTCERKKARDAAIYDAHVRYGYTQGEIAKHLDVHYVTVSRALKRVEEKAKMS